MANPIHYITSDDPPFLIMHGTADAVIPFHHGRRLFDLAGEPKQFWRIEGGGHTSALMDPAGDYRQRLAAFFTGALEIAAAGFPGLPGADGSVRKLDLRPGAAAGPGGAVEEGVVV